ncbi:MAG: exodeoxyribonuclease VII small subunit [Clostridiales bacterium]|nr:exodeoxyribonuclease VII small subunit [Clostridiales bacterium]MCF8021183.1 exodeoxyribonuclease VII small subunit [Clostridiales bacterium]
MSKKEENFEAALAQLEETVRRLEDGQIPLEEALDLFTEGVRLSKICSSQLDAAEKKIKLLLNEEGQPIIKETDDTLNGGT